MTECPLWPDTTVKKHCSFFALQVCLRTASLLVRHHVFASGVATESLFPQPQCRGLCPDDATVAAYWVRLFTVICFEDPATCVVLQGASAFALQVWRTSCHEVCFGLLKSGCARAIFYLHLINENASVLRMQHGVFSKLNWARGICPEEARAACVFARKAWAFPVHVCELSSPYSHTLSFKVQNRSRRPDAQWPRDAKTPQKRLRSAIQTLLNELNNANNTQSIYIVCLLTEFVHKAVFTLIYDGSLLESPSRAWLRACIAVEGIPR